MAEFSTIRLNVVLRELNISLDRAVEFLAQQNIEIEGRPTSKISKDVYQILLDEFETDKSKKDASHEISEVKRKEKESLRILQEKKEQERLEQLQKRQEIIKAKALISKPVTMGKIDLDATNPKPIPTSLKEVENPKPILATPKKSEAETLNKEKNDKVLKSKHEPKVDHENKEGYFLGYKHICETLSQLALQINPNYPYPHSLFATIIEAAQSQQFFAEHLPRLSDSSGSKNEIVRFLTDMTLKSLHH